MPKKVESIKHKADKRAHIPSNEEAGYEEAAVGAQKFAPEIQLPINPVTTRGKDPELFWMNKYGNDDRETLLKIDIRSLYRHEHISPEILIKNLYKVVSGQLSVDRQATMINELFGNALDKDELEKVSEYYSHQDGWTNRLIQGDSHLVMASLLEREGMAGQVQTIYIDPPYGIKYGSNWQVKMNNRDVKDGNDESLAGEPEVIKAFRDTWELGIHSYLSYIRDRLLIAKELLTESGSCFVQISDENIHLVRNVMDEVFGSDNFFTLIAFKKTLPLGSSGLAGITDYIIWYAKDKSKMKYRQLYTDKPIGEGTGYTWVELKDGTRRKMTSEEKNNSSLLPKDSKVFFTSSLASSGYTPTCMYDFKFEGKVYKCGKKSWRTNKEGMEVLIEKRRLLAPGDLPCYILYHDDFPIQEIHNLWDDTHGASDIKYVVQTSVKVIQRCLLMSTDPGDLVLDPTCGGGTTAYVAEQWGRRWITIDTSRIALNIAKQRLMTSTLPYYKLYDEQTGDIRQGFIYKAISRITLGSLANDEPPETTTLFDKPEEDKKKLRVSGPFTVETLQNFEPVAPEELDDTTGVNDEEGKFEEVIKTHLLATGIKNGRKNEMVIFTRVELLSSIYIHAEGFYMNGTGEKKAYFHIGPKFGTVSKTAVNEAIKECRQRGDAQWLIILGFSFESNIEGGMQTTSVGKFEVTKVRIHDDLLQEGLKKKPAKSAASFVTIGEPDIQIVDSSQLSVDSKNKNKFKQVAIKGLDIYDPIKDEVKPRDIQDIAYWMLDDDYDGSNFIVKQVFFCGGDKDEFAKWKKGLSDLSESKNKRKTELQDTLKIEIDDDAFDRLYGHTSHPIEVKKKGQKIAVRIISQFGEECTKVMEV